jgi:tRNA(fMet)-specific endonuclease VapC
MYLLDTNVCIALLRGNNREVRTRFSLLMRERHTIATNTIVVHELSYGAAKSAKPQQNAAAVSKLLRTIDVFAFNRDDAIAAGDIRAALEATGASIGSYDTLIAGSAVHRGATLVTANAREFSRVRGLQWEDWEKATPPQPS